MPCMKNKGLKTKIISHNISDWFKILVYWQINKLKKDKRQTKIKKISTYNEEDNQ